MNVQVKFLTPMMKNGERRDVGDIIEIDASSAVLLAEKGNVEIIGYDVVKVIKQVEVSELVPKENK